MDRLERFARAGNFAIYYGTGRGGDLAAFDVAVVEPAGQSPESVAAMQSSGTLVLAYLSVVEVPPWDPELKLLKPGDLLQLNGRPYRNEAYGNYLADLRSARWNGLLLHRAGSLLERSGYDGLFLDTIGDVESLALDGGQAGSLLLAAASLVGRMRAMFGGYVLVQNNGLERLCLLTGDYVNGICWENPSLGAPGPWARAVVSRLEALRNKGVKVMILLEEQPDTGKDGTWEPGAGVRPAENLCREKGFLLYRAPAGYTGGVNLPERVE